MIQNGQIVDVYLERADENSPAKLRTERRRDAKDRRKLHTYIADDRRSGIADRRKSPIRQRHVGDVNKK